MLQNSSDPSCLYCNSKRSPLPLYYSLLQTQFWSPEGCENEKWARATINKTNFILRNHWCCSSHFSVNRKNNLRNLHLGPKPTCHSCIHVQYIAHPFSNNRAKYETTSKSICLESSHWTIFPFIHVYYAAQLGSCSIVIGRDSCQLPSFFLSQSKLAIICGFKSHSILSWSVYTTLAGKAIDKQIYTVKH